MRLTSSILLKMMGPLIVFIVTTVSRFSLVFPLYDKMLKHISVQTIWHSVRAVETLIHLHAMSYPCTCSSGPAP